MEKEESLKGLATLLAMHVRNSMEDFHAKHLSDAQMAELNPIIRNAIYTAWLATLKAVDGDQDARKFVEWLASMVPEYWEEPQLTPDNPWDHKA